MKIVSFGHIPSWAGGLQESGLANVIYQLAKYESEIEDIEVVLAATDSFIPFRKDGALTIVGWTKKMLIGYILSHPVSTIASLCQLIRLKKRYPIRERLVGLFLKRVFMRRVLSQNAPDVVHLHGISAVWYLDLIPQQTKIALTFHGMCGLDNHLEQRDVLFKIEHDLFQSPRVNAVYFICTKLVGQFKAAYGDNGKRNQVIFNSYNERHFYYRDSEAAQARTNEEGTEQCGLVALCTVASLSDLKGQRRVIAALNEIESRDRFKYSCVGGGSSKYVEMLCAIAEEGRLNFEYLGKRSPDEIRRELYKADYMIMPSSSEGFGLTYLEAIACGTPVILPKGLPIAAERQLINSRNSILLEDCSEDSIVKALSSLDKYQFDRKTVSETISNFTWSDVAHQYIQSFQHL